MTSITHSSAPVAAPVPAEQPVDAGADRVLAAVAAALTTLPDVRHERIIMAAALLAHRHELTPSEAVELAANDYWHELVRPVWVEAVQRLDAATAQAEAVDQ